MKRGIAAMVIGAAVLMSVAGCIGQSDGGSTSEPAVESSSSLAAPTKAPTPVATPSVDDSLREYVLLNDHSASSPVVTVAGDSNVPDAGVVSAKVLVQCLRVVVYVCATQDAAMVAQTCDGAFDTFGISDTQSETVWTGTRDGTSAVVSGTDRFLWGTVTFDGVGPAAAVTVFTVASGCVDMYGNQGFHDMDQSGVCTLP